MLSYQQQAQTEMVEYERASREDWRNKPASAKQLRFAKAMGGNPAPEITRGEASDLISRLKGNG